MSQAGQIKPVWVTEYSYGASDDSDVEQAKAATELAQQAAMMLSIGIERMYYYLAQDDDSFPVRGLLGWQNDPRGWFRPHPSYAAYATVIRQLGGATFQGRMPTSLSVYAMRFQKDGEQVISAIRAAADHHQSGSGSDRTEPHLRDWKRHRDKRTGEPDHRRFKIRIREGTGNQRLELRIRRTWISGSIFPGCLSAHGVAHLAL